MHATCTSDIIFIVCTPINHRHIVKASQCVGILTVIVKTHFYSQPRSRVNDIFEI